MKNNIKMNLNNKFDKLELELESYRPNHPDMKKNEWNYEEFLKQLSKNSIIRRIRITEKIKRDINLFNNIFNKGTDYELYLPSMDKCHAETIIIIPGCSLLDKRLVSRLKTFHCPPFNCKSHHYTVLSIKSLNDIKPKFLHNMAQEIRSNNKGRYIYYEFFTLGHGDKINIYNSHYENPIERNGLLRCLDRFARRYSGYGDRVKFILTECFGYSHARKKYFNYLDIKSITTKKTLLLWLAEV